MAATVVRRALTAHLGEQANLDLLLLHGLPEIGSPLATVLPLLLGLVIRQQHRLRHPLRRGSTTELLEQHPHLHHHPRLHLGSRAVDQLHPIHGAPLQQQQDTQTHHLPHHLLVILVQHILTIRTRDTMVPTVHLHLLLLQLHLQVGYVSRFAL